MTKKLLLTLLLVPTLLFANKLPMSASAAFKLTASAIDAQTVVLHFAIAPGYHLYKNKIKVRAAGGQQLGKTLLPPAATKHSTTLGSYKAYLGNIDIGVPILNIQTNTLNLLVNYAGCSENGYCYPPQFMQLKIPMTSFPSKIIKATPQQQSTTTTGNNIIKTLQHANILWIIFSFFGFGLLIAFTPCILPMLPILYAMIIGGDKRVSLYRTITLAASYILGMALCYGAAGIAVGYAGKSMQAELQHPATIIILSIMILLMALSNFDLIHLKMPSIFSNLFNKHQQTKPGSIIGSFFMGAFASLVISPCVTPPLIGVLTFIADKGSPTIGAVALFALGIGMGLPLLILATLGNKFIPKAGAWMQRVKHLLGYVLIGLSIWLCQRIISPHLHLLIWSAWALLGGIYFGAFKLPQPRLFAKIRFVLSWLLILLGIIWAAGFIQNKTSLLYPLHKYQTKLVSTQVYNFAELKAILTNSNNKHKTFMLDFTANWCAACQWMNSTVFTNKKVVRALQHISVIKIDISAQTKQQLQITHYYNVIAPPTFIFIKNNKEIRGSRIIGESSVKDILNNNLINSTQ